VQQRALYVTFVFLKLFVSEGLLEVVAHEPVPEEARAFPLFRAPGNRDRTGRVRDWWLWDGEREWRVGELTPEQEELPIREIWTYPALVACIEDGWTPATAEAIRLAHVAEMARQEREREAKGELPPPPSEPRIRHFLYFPAELQAQQAAAAIGATGLAAEVHGPADDEEDVSDLPWLVVAEGPFRAGQDDVETLSAPLEQIAESFGGDYDGEQVGPLR
jgi:hypothetical protein